MTVGETLTEARCQAGLSVDELSERTRIRGTVIRSIEQDDYGACGGDLYVRGYVRALAGAVGIDAQPLIREFDLARASGPNERANGSTGRHAKGLPSVTAPDTAPTAFDLLAVTEPPAGRDGSRYLADLDATRLDLLAVSEDPAATAYDLPRVPEVPSTAAFPTAAFPTAPFPTGVIPASVPPAAAQPPGTEETRYDLLAVPEDLMTAGYDLRPTAEPTAAEPATSIIPALGLDEAGPRATAAWPAPGQGDAEQGGAGQGGAGQDGAGQDGAGQDGAMRTRGARKKRRGLFIAAAAVVLIVAGGVGIDLATGNTATTNTAATSVPSTAVPSAAEASAAAKASASAQAKASAAAAASTSAKASQPAAAKAPAQRITSLPVVSAVAYGPNGSTDGDDPGNAKNAIARDPSQPWSTQWYFTPTFGLLKHGTGLLLDLGGKVTVTSVRLDLAQYQGADLQIRVGNGTASQDLRVAATANNVGGVANLTLRHPTTARYLLIWFTQLPPDGSGHYQESVSHVAISGGR